MMWSLPIFCWVLCLLLLLRKGVEWRAALLSASVIWGCLVATFTELLSTFSLLAASGLAGCWVTATAIALLLNFRLKNPWHAWRLSPPIGIETVLACGIGLIFLATFITAIVSPPNTWDAMTYHMSRVMHWLQNRSVAHYPTHILRQVELNPWAEFAITQFQSLSGGDRFANLIQWFSMAGSTVGASLIAMRLGGDRRAQFFAAVVAATIPMGILQASSTQNDYVVAFWLICLAWSSLEYIRKQELRWAVMVGASLGLAVLTKGTAYLYAFPFMVWIAIAVFRGGRRRVSLSILGIVLPFILLNGAHYQRNLAVFSNPLHSGQVKYTNEDISGAGLISNLLRNAALEMSTPLDGLNKAIENFVTKIHETLNLDVNDRKTTWGTAKFKVPRLSLDEDFTGNLLHMILIAAALLTLVFFSAFRKIDSVPLCYLIIMTGGLLLFCLILKWQPWQNRLLLPWFVLVTPAIAIIIEQCWKPTLVYMVAAVLLTATFPWAFCNSHRPLLVRLSQPEMGAFPLFKYDRNQIYFWYRPPEYYHRFVQIVDDIQQKEATNIGLVLSGDSWEYPLWVLTKGTSPAPVRIEHVEVKNKSGQIKGPDFQPDYYVRGI